MFIPREILQNAAMRVAPIRRFAQSRHATGVQSDPAKSAALFDELCVLAGGSVSAARILELGPGRGTGLMAESRGRCESYAAFDVQPYLTPDEAAALDVDYRVDPTGRLPWPDGAFDVVWSHSVLEHVREPAGVLREVRRVLAPGGRHVAVIDLEDHYGGRRTATKVYEFMRYPEWLWNLMTDQRSSYSNRLRRSDWHDVVATTGFELVDEVVKPPAVDLASLREVAFLARVSDDDLMAANLTLVMRAAGDPAVPSELEGPAEAP